MVASVTPTSATPSPRVLPAGSVSEEVTQAQNTDVKEIVRRDLETRTRAVVDSLYELAARAADVQDSRQLADCVLVDAGRNPDNHTRAFMNRLASENQYSLGQHTAIRAYRDELGDALSEAFPALTSSIQQEKESYS
ncbi:hypothetical protein MPSI1_000651 [Malassezia psittaci]|uniref:Mediator of RNA polymerase II transcription subunit 10 n=1 Tax=Malassezia psittaci TaxID=1821823 RepID=A0AAF0JD52_9BASI|nr:hypothetical protein MPSI1_000651 [Malassezia psittaci]